MASTLDGCRRMIEAAERAGVILMVAQSLRYTPEATAAKALIDAGGIGEIRAVRTHAIFGVGAANPSGHWMNLVFGSEGTLHSTPPSTPSQALAQFGTIMVARGLSRGAGAMSRPELAPLPIDSVDLPTDNCFVNEILHFEECCRSGTEPITSGRDNIETVRVIMGIYESSRTGRAVDLETL